MGTLKCCLWIYYELAEEITGRWTGMINGEQEEMSSDCLKGFYFDVGKNKRSIDRNGKDINLKYSHTSHSVSGHRFVRFSFNPFPFAHQSIKIWERRTEGKLLPIEAKLNIRALYSLHYYLFIAFVEKDAVIKCCGCFIDTAYSHYIVVIWLRPVPRSN